MLHELLGENKIKIEECGISFEEMYNKPYFPKEYEEEIKKSNFLMIPEEGFRDCEEVLFPEETLKFYNYVKEHAKEDIYPEICISDEDYKELELHADVLNIVQFIVCSIALPFAINMISSYVYDKVKSRKADLDVKVKINVEVKDGFKKITYEGSAKNFKSSMETVSKTLIGD